MISPVRLADPIRRARAWRAAPALAVLAAAAVLAASAGGCAQNLATGAAGGAAATDPHAAGIIARGTDWATPYYVTDSGVAGPTVLVTGGVHGDEPAGYRAAGEIRHWPLARGRLVVVPRANVLGIGGDTRWITGEPKDRRDLNRNFPRTGAPNRASSGLGRALWAFIQDLKPDWVVDLHEGTDFHNVNPKSVGSSIVFFETPEMVAVAQAMQDAVNATIEDAERKIVLRTVGPINGGLVRATAQRCGAKGLCLETTSEGQPLSLRTREHRIMVHRLLEHLDMAAGDARVMTPPPGPERGPDRPVQVAVYDGGGTGGDGADNVTAICDADDGLDAHRVGPPGIAEGALDQFDVVVFPGGSGKAEAKALGEEAKAAVQAFVRGGGGYVGICAGAFLSSANYDWSLALLNNHTIPGRLHERGGGVVQVEVTEAGRRIFGGEAGPFGCKYHNGPMFLPAGVEGMPAFTPLALFRSELCKYDEQKGTMVNHPAIIAAPLEKGRVVAISPHPEAIPDLHYIVRGAIRWAAGE